MRYRQHARHIRRRAPDRRASPMVPRHGIGGSEDRVRVEQSSGAGRGIQPRARICRVSRRKEAVRQILRARRGGAGSKAQRLRRARRSASDGCRRRAQIRNSGDNRPADKGQDLAVLPRKKASRKALHKEIPPTRRRNVVRWQKNRKNNGASSPERKRAGKRR